MIILKVCNQRLYLLNKLKHAGLDEQGLATVFQAIVVSRVLHALLAWFWQLTQLDIGHINGLFCKAHRWQLSGRVYTVEQLARMADAGLFKVIASNPNHSLYQILPPFTWAAEQGGTGGTCTPHLFWKGVQEGTLCESLCVSRCAVNGFVPF